MLRVCCWTSRCAYDTNDVVKGGDRLMSFTMAILGAFGLVAYTAVILWIGIQIIRMLLRYIRSTPEERRKEITVKRTLAEALKEHRLQRNMTQDFVAEKIGVSRQAVSKWENGSSDPSTMNLLAIAELYGVEAGELLRGVVLVKGKGE